MASVACRRVSASRRLMEYSTQAHSRSMAHVHPLRSNGVSLFAMNEGNKGRVRSQTCTKVCTHNECYTPLYEPLTAPTMSTTYPWRQKQEMLFGLHTNAGHIAGRGTPLATDSIPTYLRTRDMRMSEAGCPPSASNTPHMPYDTRQQRHQLVWDDSNRFFVVLGTSSPPNSTVEMHDPPNLLPHQLPAAIDTSLLSTHIQDPMSATDTPQKSIEETASTAIDIVAPAIATLVPMLCNKQQNDGRNLWIGTPHKGKWKHMHFLKRKAHLKRYAHALQGVDILKMKHLKWGEVIKLQ